MGGLGATTPFSKLAICAVLLEHSMKMSAITIQLSLAKATKVICYVQHSDMKN